MLLNIAALAFALSPGALAARFELGPTPVVQQRYAAIFPRQTDLGGLDSGCLSVLTLLTDIPTAPPDLSSYIQQAAATMVNPCSVSYPNSLTKELSSYQSEVQSWFSAKKNILSQCPELLSYQSQFSDICKTTAGGSPSQTSGSSSATTTSSGSSGGSGSGSGSGNSGSDNSGNGSNTGSSGGSSLSGGAIAGIAVGGVAGLAAIVGIIAFLVWRARRKSKAASANTSQPDMAQQQQQMPPPGMVQQPGQPYDKNMYPYPPQGQYVYEMPQPGMQPPSELMGNVQAPPAELGYSSGPVYEMPGGHPPK